MARRTTDPYLHPATRILATLGPSSWTPPAIRALALAGASAFRLNFSHGDHEILREVITNVRAVSWDLGRPIAILGDLCGPKLRTGVVRGGGTVHLVEGEEVIVAPGEPTTTARRIGVNHAGLSDDVKVGDRLLLDDGKLRLEVVRRSGKDLVALVKHGGELSSHKGLNVPGVRVSIPAITPKDERDLEFALQHGVDWIALSFVQEARDVVDLKRRIAMAPSAKARTTPVIAKIEKPLAIENLDPILEVSDGIMVARGDLGVELGPEELPMVQKRLILTARRRSKLVITATQMLDSMTHHPSPTRAEASDVANAIFDGTDVVMLSQETAVGEFPVLTVETMRSIAMHAEESELYRQHMEHFQRPISEGVAQAAIRAACVAAEEVSARAVIPFSTSGWTAYCVSAWRPHTSIYACTHLEETYNRLALCWGLRPILVPSAETLDELYVVGVATLLRLKALDPGDIAVVLTGSVLRGHGANTIKIYRVGTPDLTDDPATREKLERLTPGARIPAEDDGEASS